MPQFVQIALGVVALGTSVILTLRPEIIYALSDRMNLPTSEARGYDRDSPEYQRTQQVLRIVSPLFTFLLGTALLARGFGLA